jgi:hypothetical protein
MRLEPPKVNLRSNNFPVGMVHGEGAALSNIFPSHALKTIFHLALILGGVGVGIT